ncbi:MAG: fasciclin domain-containing protein [Salinibacter sp.]
MMKDTATSRLRWSRLGFGLIVFALVLAGCDSEDLGDSEQVTPSIGEYVAEVQGLSTLHGAVQAAGLSGELEADGRTLFAPLNSAFEPAIDPSLNPGVAEKVIQHHLVDGETPSSSLSDGQSLTPLAGSDLIVGVDEGENAEDNVVTSVNRAAVTNADADASNGLVHVVDGLLADAVDRATLTPQFSIFARLVKEADLEGPLRTGSRTLFVPTNDALLEAFDDNGNGEIESGELPSNAADVLQYHVLDSVFLAADVPTSETDVATLEGSDVTVVRDGDSGAVTINPAGENASVSVADVEVDNGVIHGIDTVLVP